MAESEGDEELRDRVRELTSKRQSGKDVKQIVAELTPVLRGWGNYFRTGNADREFNKMDGEAGNGQPSARHSLAISFMVWVCIG